MVSVVFLGTVSESLQAFECAAPALAWINERVFVGVGVRRPQTVVMRFFEIL